MVSSGRGFPSLDMCFSLLFFINLFSIKCFSIILLDTFQCSIYSVLENSDCKHLICCTLNIEYTLDRSVEGPLVALKYALRAERMAEWS